MFLSNTDKLTLLQCLISQYVWSQQLNLLSSYFSLLLFLLFMWGEKGEWSNLSCLRITLSLHMSRQALVSCRLLVVNRNLEVMLIKKSQEMISTWKKLGSIKTYNWVYYICKIKANLFTQMGNYNFNSHYPSKYP